MRGIFKFGADEREELMVPAFADSPIGTEEQIDAFIDEMEVLITQHINGTELSSPTETRKKLRIAAKVLAEFYRVFLGENNILDDLQEYYANVIGSQIPHRESLEEALAALQVGIVVKLGALDGIRKTRVPYTVYITTAALVFRYVSAFGVLPSISNRYTGRKPKEPTPFAHFLDHLLIAIGQPPRDTKHLTKHGIRIVERTLSAIDAPITLSDLTSDK